MRKRAELFLAQKSKQTTLALADAREALRIDSGDAHAMRLKAHCLASDGSYGKAVATIRKAIEQSPDDSAILREAVEIFMSQGEYEAAIELCECILKTDPKSSFASARRATCYTRLQKSAPPLSL